MRKDKDVLVLDIGTEAVKTFGAAPQYYDQFGVFDSRDFGADVIKKAITKIISDPAKPIILGLPPDVLKARVSSQFLERKNPQKVIGGREQKEIEKEILRNNKKEVSEVFLQESGILPQELEFLEQLFLGVKIDGYLVPSLQGYQGGKVEVGILSVFSAKENLWRFQRIFQELGSKVLKIIHPVQNLTKVFENVYCLPTEDGVFLDVGGEITQIFVVKSGKLAMIADFPMGGRDFSKTISQTLGFTGERARILKERYSQGKISENTRKEFNQIFSDLSKEWHHNLKLKLKEFKGFLPQNFFLFGGGSQLPEILEVLEGEYSPEILKNPQEINLILLINAR